MAQKIRAFLFRSFPYGSFCFRKKTNFLKMTNFSDYYKNRDQSSSCRQNSQWLEGAEWCDKRAVPCGNPTCVDEVMRASEMSDVGGRINHINAKQIYEKALQIRKECEQNIDCPIKHNREKFLQYLYWAHKVL